MNRRLVLAGAAAFALGLALWLLGLLLAPGRALAAWLMAWSYAASVALGALVLVLIMNAVSGKWFLVFRRLAEAVSGSLVALALLFIPVAAGLGRLYPWVAQPDPEKRPWLAPGFFLVRSAVYLALFAVTVLVLRRLSLRQDRDPDEALVARQRAFSTVILPPIALAITFGAIDWLMSLTPEWVSTIYGIYYWAGGFVAAIALLVIAAQAHRARVPGLRPPHFYALGRLLLAFTIFWTYIAYAQGFIIWIGNKPDEVPWYVVRTRGGWGVLAVVLLFAHFVIPFAILLLRAVKLRPRALVPVAAWLLLAHLLDIYWVVMPSLTPAGFQPHWVDLAALAAVLGACLAVSAAWLRGHALLPEAAPGLAAGLAYEPWIPT